MSADASIPRKPLWENPETRQVLDAMTEFFAAIDENYDIVFVNQALATASPRGYHGFVGHNVWEFWPTMRNPVVEEALARAFRTGLTGRFDFHYEPQDLFIDVSVSPSDGYLFLYFRDVTAQVRERAERAQRESALQALLSALPHIAWSADASGNPTFINERWRAYTGSNGTGLKDIQAVIHPDDLPQVTVEALAARIPEETRIYRLRLRRHDGEYRWHEVRSAPYVAPDGKIAYIGTTTDVHAEHVGREALEESQRRLQALMAQPTVGIAHTDLTGRFTFANDRQCQLLGRPREAILGRRMQEFTHPEDLPGNAELFHRMVASGEGFTIEKRYVQPDGSSRWVHNHVSLVCDDHDDPSYALAVCTDVTDRKEAEQERERLLIEVDEERDRLTQVLESIRDAFYAVDAEYRFTYVNRRAEELWGRRREELLGRVYWKEFPQAVGSESYLMHHKVMAERRPIQYETVSPIVGRWIDVSIYPDEQGGLSCYFRDIDDRKAAETARRESEERYRVLADSMPMVVWSTNPEGEVDYYNARWYEFTDTDPSRLDGGYWRQIMHPDDYPRVVEIWSESLRTGSPYEAEFRYLDGKTGHYRWFLGRALPQRDAEGRILRWYGSSTDIHEQKSRERTLAFMAELGEVTKPLIEPDEVMAAAARALGQALEASRCAYCEVADDGETLLNMQDWSPEWPSISGRDFVLSQFGPFLAEPLRRGQTLVSNDVRAEANEADAAALTALQIEAVIVCPLMKGGRLVAIMAVHSPRPRMWTPEEVELTSLVVERCWTEVQRTRAEREVRESEERFRLLVESVPEIAWTARPDGYIDYYNERWYEYTGASRGQTGDESWTPLLHPDDQEKTYRIWSHSVATGEPYETELRMRDQADGSFRWFLARARPLRDAHGHIIRWFGMTTDIHDAKVKQELLAFAGELADAKRHLSDPREILAVTSRMLGEHLTVSRCAYAEVDVDAGTFTIEYDWSPTLPSIQGTFPIAAFGERIPHSQFAGQTLVIDDLPVQLAGDPAVESLGAMGIAAVVCVPLVKEGRLVAMMAVHQDEPRRWKPEEVDLVEMVADRCWSSIERARAENRVREAYADLERKVRERTAELQAANDALQGFTYHVSHDLRAPLRAIVATSRMVEEDYGAALPGEAQALLHRQASSAKKLGQLIDDLLRLSRLSREPLEVQRIDLSELAREAAADALGSHPATTVRVEIQPDVEAEADIRLLKLAMTNLIENAIKYSPSGGTVRVGQRPDGVYFVADEGIGIDPRYHERIFEPFQRLHRDDEFQGTGIGLSNVRQVMTRHGGQVWVESALGQGSTFLFTLA